MLAGFFYAQVAGGGSAFFICVLRRLAKGESILNQAPLRGDAAFTRNDARRAVALANLLLANWVYTQGKRARLVNRASLELAWCRAM